jgi:membrane-bound lytic murein transglycosylase D
MPTRASILRRITSLLLLTVTLTVITLTSPPISAQSEHFPRPAELEPAIRFWTRVYTEVDTKSGFLHDAMNMGVVYQKVDNDREQIEHFRRRIQADLQVLAAGRRSGLTLTQQQVLDAWPEGVSNSALAEAVNNVRFQLGQSDRFVGGLIRSGAYREHIERVARERGLPLELAALPHVESSFHPGAHSHANAAGMWQFLRATGQRFMRIDNIVDERMDPYAATHAAMSLLEYNYNVLGTWPLALTAYNQGAGGMSRAVRATGSNRIEDIILNYRGGSFGFAGRNFYPQLLAVLDVERQAQALFGILQLDPAPEYDEYELTAYIEAQKRWRMFWVLPCTQLRFDNPALQTRWYGRVVSESRVGTR